MRDSSCPADYHIPFIILHYHPTMNFLRLSRQQLMGRRRQWQQYLILKHYDINWGKLAPSISLEMHTPLFQL